MQYLCLKQLTVAGKPYYPGDTVPDGAILPERSDKLVKSGYISKLHEAAMQEGSAMLPKEGIPADGEVFTREQVERMLSEAIEEAVNNTILEMERKQAGPHQYTAELQAIPPDIFEDTVLISVRAEGSGENRQMMALRAEPQEIQQVFSIMQLNAEEGARAVADVRSENVLILLHVADSRKTIKNAAKEQADKLFSTKGDANESCKGNASKGTNLEGADT